MATAIPAAPAMIPPATSMGNGVEDADGLGSGVGDGFGEGLGSGLGAARIVIVSRYASLVRPPESVTATFGVYEPGFA
jgi:hypothetical protein